MMRTKLAISAVTIELEYCQQSIGRWQKFWDHFVGLQKGSTIEIRKGEMKRTSR